MASERGPVELLILGFPGNQFSGEITPALVKLIDSGTIRVLDLLFVTKNEAGDVAGIELADLDEPTKNALGSLIGEQVTLLSEEDMEDAAEILEPNSSAALLLFEHAWAAELRSAIINSGGELIDWLRIPAELIDEGAGAAAS